jgi:hypothetical protein
MKILKETLDNGQELKDLISTDDWLIGYFCGVYNLEVMRYVDCDLIERRTV